MGNRRRAITPIALAVTVALAAAACGSGDGNGTTATDPPLEPPPTTAPDDGTDDGTTPPDRSDPDSTDPPGTEVPPADDPATSVALCADVPVVVSDVLTEQAGLGGIDPVIHGVLLTYADEHDDVFGGLWIDREAGGTIVLAFTDDPEPHRSALAARQPSPDDVAAVEPAPEIVDDRPLGEQDVAFDVVQVRWTEDELVGLTGAVIERLQAADLPVDGAGVDVMRNRVRIDLTGVITPDVRGEVDAALAADRNVHVDALCLAGDVRAEAPEPIEPGTPLEVIVLPDPDGSYPPDTMVECAGTTFPLGALADPTPIDEVSDDLRAVVDSWTTRGEMAFPDEGWFLLHEDGERATMAAIDADGFWTVGAEMGRNGWIWASASGGGPCDVSRVLPEGLGPVEWELDPDSPPPEAGTTELDLLVTELACTGGSELGDRLLGPQVVETDDAVRIAFAAIPLGGAHTCPGNPPASVTVTLESPLGDRDLLDGLVVAPIAELFQG